MSNPNHPIWGLAKIVVVGALTVFVLWAQQNFMDSRDLTTIISLMLAIGAMEFGPKLLKKGGGE